MYIRFVYHLAVMHRLQNSENYESNMKLFVWCLSVAKVSSKTRKRKRMSWKRNWRSRKRRLLPWRMISIRTHAKSYVLSSLLTPVACCLLDETEADLRHHCHLGDSCFCSRICWWSACYAVWMEVVFFSTSRVCCHDPFGSHFIEWSRSTDTPFLELRLSSDSSFFLSSTHRLLSCLSNRLSARFDTIKWFLFVSTNTWLRPLHRIQ